MSCLDIFKSCKIFIGCLYKQYIFILTKTKILLNWKVNNLSFNEK